MDQESVRRTLTDGQWGVRRVRSAYCRPRQSLLIVGAERANAGDVAGCSTLDAELDVLNIGRLAIHSQAELNGERLRRIETLERSKASAE